jgi:hypothetical protein
VKFATFVATSSSVSTPRPRTSSVGAMTETGVSKNLPLSAVTDLGDDH